MTLNGLAYQYIITAEEWPALPYLLPVPGFLLGLLVPNPGRLIARGPNWLASLVLVLLLALQQFLWFAMPAATVAGVLWLIALADVLAASVFGFLLGRLGKARSRDAFGHAGWGVLQLVPLLNLPLLLTRSRAGTEDQPRLLSSWDLPAGIVVVLGLTLIGTTKGLESLLETQLEPALAAEIEGNEAFATIFFRYQIEAQGLPAVIAEIAAGQPDPVEVEPGHRVLKLTADGAVLHVYHELDEPDAEELTPDYRRALISDTCDGLGDILQAGGKVSRHFSRSVDGEEFEVLDIRNGDCFV